MEPQVIDCTKHTELPKIGLWNYCRVPLLQAYAKHAAMKRPPIKVVYVFKKEIYIPVEIEAK